MTTNNAPEIEQSGRTWFRFTWQDARVTCSRVRLHTSSDRLTAIIDVRATPEDPKVETDSDGMLHLHQQLVNFLAAANSKDSLAKALNSRREGLPWASWMEFIGKYITTKLAEGDPVVMLQSDAEVIGPLQYLVYPFLPLHEVAMLYGMGGTAKSLFAKLLCILAQFGNTPTGQTLARQLNVVADQEPTKALFLDYETYEGNAQRRVRFLADGMGIPKFEMAYMRCYTSIANDIEAIGNQVVDKNIGLVCVDSAGMATGSDIREQQVVSEMIMALRQLACTVLIITHEPELQPGQKPKPFGSVYFRNETRSLWRVESTQQPESPDLYCVYTHQKANDSGLFRPYSYHCHFEGDAWTSIKHVSLDDIPDLAHTRPLNERLTKLLGEGAGYMGIDDIYKAITDKALSTIKARLYDLRKQNKVYQSNIGGKAVWCLTTREEERWEEPPIEEDQTQLPF